MPRTDVTVKLVGGDGHAFVILGKVVEALRAAGHKELAEDYITEATATGNYDDLLRVTMEYLHV